MSGRASSEHVTAEEQIDAWSDQIHWMKHYATEQGKAITADIAASLADEEVKVREIRALREAKDRALVSPASASAENTGNAAFERGVDAAYSEKLSDTIKSVLSAHAKLSELVKPATPDSIRWSSAGLKDVAGKERVWFVWLNVIVALTLLTVAVLFLSNSVANDPKSQEWRAHVIKIALAGLGASFYNLYWIHFYLANRTFDKAYRTSYLIRLALGTVAGYLLAYVIPLFNHESADEPKALSAYLLAIVGGYSADAVNDVMLRIAETVRTLVKGSGDQMLKSQQMKFEAELKRSEVMTKAQTATSLAGIIAQAKAAGSSDETIKKLQEMVDSLIVTQK